MPEYRQMPDPNMQAGQQLVKVAMERYKIDLRDEKQRQSFGQQNAIAGYIAGEIIPGLNDPKNPLTPNEAMIKLVNASREAGVDPRVSIGIYDKQMEIITKQAKANNMDVNKYLRQIKLKQEITAKTPGGIMETEALKKGEPLIKSALNKLKQDVSAAMIKLGKKDTEERRLMQLGKKEGYEGLRPNVFGGGTRTFKEAARLIAGRIMEGNEAISAYIDIDDLTIRVMEILRNPKVSLTLKRKTQEVGMGGLEAEALLGTIEGG